MEDIENILDALKSHNIFLTGGAGVGKSFNTTKVIDRYREDDMGVVVLGSTGISAVNIGGSTLHSFFIFGISNNFNELQESDRRNRKKLTNLKKILKATDLIIIDEISMVSTELLDMIYFRLENFRYNGKVMFVGDFFQLPPVHKYKQNNQLLDNALYAFESLSWQKLNLIVIELTQMKRTKDMEFAHILHKIRVGVCDNEVLSYLANIYNNNSIYSKKPTQLYGRNQEVERINRIELDKLTTDETILFSNTIIHKDINPKRLESWKKLLPILDMLVLKVGVPILFTVNRWGEFVNGERGTLIAINSDSLIVRKSAGDIVTVERYDFELLEMEVKGNGSVESVSLATLSQFPIKLAYAVTIHKSQGMSIDNLICNVDNIFEPSQFYVAISRATNPKNLKIDFNRGNLLGYLQHIIRVDSRVIEYYRDIIK
jgi:ATP-dependent exoDNAse (exonuclease V) alpha subunit